MEHLINNPDAFDDALDDFLADKGPEFAEELRLQLRTLHEWEQRIQSRKKMKLDTQPAYFALHNAQRSFGQWMAAHFFEYLEKY